MKNRLYHISELVFSYHQKKGSLTGDPVLRISDLKILENRVTVIRGHNGSGKSTLLKLLCGLLRPSEGVIQTSRELRSVLVQQEPYLFHGSVLHNLTAALRFQRGRQSGENEKASRALEMVGLQGFEKRKARELSGGEKKRVAIARALMTDPEVLLLDEPDANVDNRTSKELEYLIGDLKDKGLTIILCSHNRGFAYRTCDDLVDLYQGCPVDHDENIFKGIYKYSPGMFSEFSIGDWIIRCPSLQGEFNTAVIPPESITLLPENQSRGEGNVCSGKILEIIPSKTGMKILSITGTAELSVLISDAELSVLDLHAGDCVVLLFNPSSVRLY